MIGRAVLKILKQTTLNTFFIVAKDFGLKANTHFNYNQQDGLIKFWNGSEILLKDLAHMPSDPEFQELGSLEITDAFIDEAAEITQKCFNIVNSRIRYKLDEFELVPKLLLTCNPSKNWLYHEFYKKHKQGELDDTRAFVQSLVHDNPHISRHYITNLKKLDKVSYLRLYKGDWEYSDDDMNLCEYDAILDMYTNTLSDQHGKYITCDAARLGKDKTVIMVWHGFVVKQIKVIPKCTNDQLEQEIIKLKNKYNVPMSHIAVDEVGLGAGIVDHLKCKGFVAGASPIQPRISKKDPLKKVQYANLKTQCFFLLADAINKREIAVENSTPEIRQALTQELELLKQVDADKDGKLKMTSKDDIKNIIGRSPDYSDCLSFRFLFELKKPSGFKVVQL